MLMTQCQFLVIIGLFIILRLKEVEFVLFIVSITSRFEEEEADIEAQFWRLIFLLIFHTMSVSISLLLPPATTQCLSIPLKKRWPEMRTRVHRYRR